MVPVQVNGVEAFATIDSAAQISIIKTTLFEQLPGNLQQAGTVKLKGIGKKNNIIPAIRIVGVKITLGKSEFPWDVFLADTADTILLGLDFLRGNQCVLDFASNTIHLQDNIIIATVKKNGEGEMCKVHRVSTTRRTLLRPKCVARLPVKVNDADKGSTFVVEPLNGNLGGLLGAVTCTHEEGHKSVINETDHHIIVRQGVDVTTSLSDKEWMLDLLWRLKKNHLCMRFRKQKFRPVFRAPLALSRLV